MIPSEASKKELKHEIRQSEMREQQYKEKISELQHQIEQNRTQRTALSLELVNREEKEAEQIDHLPPA